MEVNPGVTNLTGGVSRFSSHSDDSGIGLMDVSLTDMQWLPGMNAGGGKYMNTWVIDSFNITTLSCL